MRPLSSRTSYAVAQQLSLAPAEEAVRRAQTITRLLYGSDYRQITTADLLLALDGDARLKRCTRAELFETPVVKLVAAHGLVSSNGARFFLHVLCPGDRSR